MTSSACGNVGSAVGRRQRRLATASTASELAPASAAVLGPSPAAATATADTAGAELAPQPAQAPLATPADVAAATGLVRAYRTVGHRAAQLDPLGGDPPGDPSLDPASWGLTGEGLAWIPASVLRVSVGGERLADVVPQLRRTYCGTIAFEVEHISSHDERARLRQAIESGDYRTPLAADERRALLARLTVVEALEHFLHRAYLGQKRFSIEGLDVLVPMLDQLIEFVAASGARMVEIGMTHRGPLNVLAHLVGVAYAEILAEFQRSRATADAEVPAEGETRDVKYHRGASGVYETAAGPGHDLGLVQPQPPRGDRTDRGWSWLVGSDRSQRTGARP